MYATKMICLVLIKPQVTQQSSKNVIIMYVSIQRHCKTSVHMTPFGLRTLCHILFRSLVPKVSQSCRVPEWKQRKCAFLVCGCHQRLSAGAMGKKTVISSNGLYDMHFFNSFYQLDMALCFDPRQCGGTSFPPNQIEKSWCLLM